MSQYFIKWAERLSVISSISARLLYVCMFVCLLFFAAPTPTPMTTSLCCVENNDSDRLAALHDLFFLCKQLKMAIAIVIEFMNSSSPFRGWGRGKKCVYVPAPKISSYPAAPPMFKEIFQNLLSVQFKCQNWSAVRRRCSCLKFNGVATAQFFAHTDRKFALCSWSILSYFPFNIAHKILTRAPKIENA